MWLYNSQASFCDSALSAVVLTNPGMFQDMVHNAGL